MSDHWKLDPLVKSPARPGPVLLVVMDGVGVGRGDAGDAVSLAHTPVLDRLRREVPYLTLNAHGTAVGMPSDGDMGNSEVGHNALGCGRVFDQGAKLVDRAIASGAIFKGETWEAVIEQCRTGGTLHLIGLLSDGNVHSHIDQLTALIREADHCGVGELAVHILLDGRDVGETSALEYVDTLEACLGEIDRQAGRHYRIASGGGRMLVTMDRYEADWSIVERGWTVHVLGEGRVFPDARTAIESFREEEPGTTDQFLPAFVIEEEDEAPTAPIVDGDAVVFFNFRGDRAIEISKAFEQDDFPHFDRRRRPEVLYAGMMEYDGDQHIPSRYLVKPPAIDRTLGEYCCMNGITQLAVAETQKYGHVTYFWNGNCSGLFDPDLSRYVEADSEEIVTDTYRATARRSALETQIEVESDRIPFEQRPWMKAGEVTDVVIDGLRSGDYSFVRVNYANGDMVGHTGDLTAAIGAVAAVDLSLKRLLKVIRELDGLAIITADHGNADEMYMIDRKTGDFEANGQGGFKAKTSHTLNPVPCYLYDPRGAGSIRFREQSDDLGLANMAATVLNLLGFAAPRDYRESLIDI